jgi:hypothetical protein
MGIKGSSNCRKRRESDMTEECTNCFNTASPITRSVQSGHYEPVWHARRNI